MGWLSIITRDVVDEAHALVEPPQQLPDVGEDGGLDEPPRASEVRQARAVRPAGRVLPNVPVEADGDVQLPLDDKTIIDDATIVSVIAELEGTALAA
jgi:hypothetical protein